MPLVRIFFVVVYVFGVLVALNIVVAFAIGSYTKVLEATQVEAEQGREVASDSPEESGDVVADAEFREDRIEIRERSESIYVAQSKLRAYVPFHMPEYDKANEVLARATAKGTRVSRATGANCGPSERAANCGPSESAASCGPSESAANCGPLESPALGGTSEENGSSLDDRGAAACAKV